MPQEEEGIPAQRASREEELREIREVESVLADAQRHTAKALEGALRRLEEVEALVSEAEAHVASAERLAKLKADETERKRRLYRCSNGSPTPSTLSSEGTRPFSGYEPDPPGAEFGGWNGPSAESHLPSNCPLSAPALESMIRSINTGRWSVGRKET
jgi:hypothetical protein